MLDVYRELSEEEQRIVDGILFELAGFSPPDETEPS